MKKNLFYLFIALFCISLSQACTSNADFETESQEEEVTTRATVDYPTTGLNGMLGFAGEAYDHNGSYKGRTTGGTGGQVVYIYTLNDLQQNISGSTAKILVIANDIVASQKTRVYLGSNKSLIGSYAKHTLNNIYLAANSSTSNIIFQNLTFVHSAAINDNDDIQLYLNYGRNYWIDHVTFQGHAYDPNGSDLDKLLYVGAQADYVTISNSKFMNHRYGFILGYPQDGAGNGSTYDGYPHMSIFNNYFENVYTRAPGLMRYGYYHVKNNYINNFRLGYTIAQNAKIRSEANYFGEGSQYGGILDDKGTGAFTDVNSYPTPTRQSSPTTNWNPSGNYSGYVVQTAEYAKAFAINWAGAQNSSSTLVFGY